RARAGAAGALLAPGFLVRAGDLAHVAGAGSAHALVGVVGDHGVVDGLRAFAAFDEREFHFQLAGAVALRIFNGQFHGDLLLGLRFWLRLWLGLGSGLGGALGRLGRGLGGGDGGARGFEDATAFLGLADDDVVALGAG